MTARMRSVIAVFLGLTFAVAAEAQIAGAPTPPRGTPTPRTHDIGGPTESGRDVGGSIGGTPGADAFSGRRRTPTPARRPHRRRTGHRRPTP